MTAEKLALGGPMIVRIFFALLLTLALRPGPVIAAAHHPKTVAGIEGTDAPLHLTADDLWNEERPTFALPSGIIYFVVDDRTGVILANGIRLPR